MALEGGSIRPRRGLRNKSGKSDYLEYRIGKVLLGFYSKPFGRIHPVVGRVGAFNVSAQVDVVCGKQEVAIPNLFLWRTGVGKSCCCNAGDVIGGSLRIGLPDLHHNVDFKLQGLGRRRKQEQVFRRGGWCGKKISPKIIIVMCNSARADLNLLRLSAQQEVIRLLDAECKEPILRLTTPAVGKHLMLVLHLVCVGWRDSADTSGIESRVGHCLVSRRHP